VTKRGPYPRVASIARDLRHRCHPPPACIEWQGRCHRHHRPAVRLADL